MQVNTNIDPLHVIVFYITSSCHEVIKRVELKIMQNDTMYKMFQLWYDSEHCSLFTC